MVQQPLRALCLGGADCVWDDVLAWEDVYGKQWDGLVIVANDIGSHFPREIHHWVSLHAYGLPKWKAQRKQHRLPEFTGPTWSREYRMDGSGADREVEPWAGGSSGMLAVQVAKEVGCTRAVLCGIPMTATPHFGETYENFHTQWLAAAGHWRAWGKCADKMQGWVRSMSGRTREMLGTPDLEWLQGG